MSKKDLIEQNITRVQEYVRELIEDAKYNNGVSETLESTSIIVGIVMISMILQFYLLLIVNVFIVNS